MFSILRKCLLEHHVFNIIAVYNKVGFMFVHISLIIISSIYPSPIRHVHKYDGVCKHLKDSAD